MSTAFDLEGPMFLPTDVDPAVPNTASGKKRDRSEEGGAVTASGQKRPRTRIQITVDGQNVVAGQKRARPDGDDNTENTASGQKRRLNEDFSDDDHKSEGGSAVG